MLALSHLVFEQTHMREAMSGVQTATTERMGTRLSGCSI